MKIETKVSQKDNSLFFNDDCNVYSAEPHNVPFKFNNQIKLSPSDSGMRQSTKYSIDDILKKTPNCEELVTLSATLTAVTISMYQSTLGMELLKLRKIVLEKILQVLCFAKCGNQYARRCRRTTTGFKVRGPKNGQIYEIFKILEYGLL